MSWKKVKGPARVGDIVNTPMLWGRYRVDEIRERGDFMDAVVSADDFSTVVDHATLYNITRDENGDKREEGK